MNRRNLLILVLKYLLPTLIIQSLFLLNTYLSQGYLVPFGIHRIIIFLGILIFVIIFWSFISYLELRVGELMEANWKQRIVFIAIALVLIYLYKATGRI